MTLPHMRLCQISGRKKKRRNVRTDRLYIYAPLLQGIRKGTWKRQGITAVCGKERLYSIGPAPTFPQFMDDTVAAERSLAMFMNMVLLGRCEQVWVFGSRISAGMAAEIGKAERGICRSAISQRIVRRLDYLENDILHGKLQGQCKEQHLSKQACR